MNENPPNPFLEKLREGRTAFGSFVFSSDPAATEIVGAAGFELAIIDTEHAGLTIEHIHAHARAARARGLSWWVRTGKVVPAEIARFLDAGAQGIMFPHFGAEKSSLRGYASRLRYPPAGTRPTCTGMPTSDYGLTPFADYAERANKETMAIGLVEDRVAVENIDDILASSDIDAVMPGGVGDLASSYGVHGQGDHPQVVGAAQKVIAAAKRAGKKVGVYLSDVAGKSRFQSLEPDFYIYSIDYKVLAAAYGDIRRRLSGESR